MFKYFIIMLTLTASCGKDDSASAPLASSPPPVIQEVSSEKPEPSTEPTAKPKAVATVKPTATPSPSASPTPEPKIALEMIVSQPYETNDWAMDLRTATLSYGTDHYNTTLTVYKKTPAGPVACWLRVSINIPNDDSEWLYITMTRLSGTTPPECWSAGETTKYMTFKIATCQGYNQQTYVCGTNGIVYDLKAPY